MRIGLHCRQKIGSLCACQIDSDLRACKLGGLNRKSCPRGEVWIRDVRSAWPARVRVREDAVSARWRDGPYI